ncbi:acyltransferase family protein [Azotosporobacter soli]|uniref:acyltransferase family protein n=1 Tax=Azotosporobacter soli TaxID=3055040 RepID=UPI0031FEB75C
MQQALSEAKGETKKRVRERLYFFDNLRTAIILLVIVFHVAISFMHKPPQWWYVIDTQNSKLFDLFVMLADVFIMPVLFLTAGYFALPALLRKGGSAFWRSKGLRIVLPWLCGVMLFAPLITYMIYFSRTPTPPPYIPYWSEKFFLSQDYNQAHYWFLGALAWFYAALTAAFYLKPKRFYPSKSPQHPTTRAFILFGFVTAGGFLVGNLFMPADAWFHKLYVFSFQPSRVFLCFAYFCLGVYAWKKRWFTAKGYQPALRNWLPLTGLSLMVFVAYRLAFTLETPVPLLFKVGHGIVHAFFCLAMTFALLAAFRTYGNGAGPVWRNLAKNSYGIYYIHQFFVLALTYVVQKWTVSVWLKYSGVSLTALLSCWLCAELIRRFLPRES